MPTYACIKIIEMLKFEKDSKTWLLNTFKYQKSKFMIEIGVHLHVDVHKQLDDTMTKNMNIYKI